MMINYNFSLKKRTFEQKKLAEKNMVASVAPNFKKSDKSYKIGPRKKLEKVRVAVA